VYFIDAYASEAMIEGGTVTLDQPTHVRFGPFDEYVELTYETLRAGPDGRNIGVFDVATETWQIDELIFSDLAIAATPSGEVVAGTGVYGHGEQPTTRYPTTRY
jgi:hypothetical protein